MPHPFEVRNEIEVAATPEQVWEAIATGTGIDGWFLGTGNEVESRVGGRVRISFGDESGPSTVTTWDPPMRFGHRGDTAPDGSLHAFEYEIEGRGGRTLVRLVHSGFLGDDWEAEYEALGEGDYMYLHLMGQWIAHFRGRPVTTFGVFRPETRGREQAVALFNRGLGLAGTATEGDRVSFAVDGQPPVRGVVDFTSASIVGVRTDDALYRFLYSPQGIVYAGHHLYRSDVDEAAAKAAWQVWLDQTFA
jgi:uncharacterized protein YndB with AHSA1/START domain